MSDRRALACALCLPMFVGCGATEPECLEANHCELVEGEAFCSDGYEWEAPDDSANFNCVAIEGPSEPDPVEPDPGLPILGGGTHEMTGVELVPVLQAGMIRPRDIEVNPNRPSELWVVSQGSQPGDSAIVVIFEPGTPSQSSQSYGGFGNYHFLARPSALAFGEDGFFATAHEEDEETQGNDPDALGYTPPDFMGPTLWLDDLSFFDGGYSSHMDMLHNSPNAVGIAWVQGNEYFVYDGYHRALTSYDFNMHHGAAGSDHTDGVVVRYVESEMGYAPDVSSHIIYDQAGERLYAADTANNKIMVLDPASGTRGANIEPNYDSSLNQQYEMNDAVLDTFIDGAAVEGLEKPSGIEIEGEHIFVSDHQTGRIFAFDFEGQVVDWLDTGLTDGCLSGMSFGPDGSLFMVDVANESIWVLRRTP